MGYDALSKEALNTNWVAIKKMARVCFIFILFAFSSAHAQMSKADEPVNIMIVLDASGSMRERQEGRSKMDIAKSALKMVLRTMPQNVRVGLRVYGHQSPKRFHDCQDTRLEIPLDYLNYRLFTRVLDNIEPRGYTPLAYSLQKCERDFFGPGKNIIICLTDGIETCGGDPCAIADSLRQSNIEVTIHVVGFDVGKRDREILMCIPRKTGGQYFSAENPEKLRKALREVFDLAINPGYIRLQFRDIVNKYNIVFGRVYDIESQYLFVNATTTHPVPLPPGLYNLSRFYLWSNIDSNPYFPDGNLTIEGVRIKSDEETTVVLDQFGIVNAFVELPKEKPESIVLSFQDRKQKHIIPDRVVDGDAEAMLLRTGEYDFTCTLVYPDREVKQTLANQIVESQTVQNITFDFKKRTIPAWVYWLLSLIPIGLVIYLLTKLQKKNNPHSTLEDFARHPQDYKGEVVSLQLCVRKEDLGYGKNVTFGLFYPIIFSMNIFVPNHLKEIVNFDTRYKIRVSFLCKLGKIDEGNILVSFKRGKKI